MAPNNIEPGDPLVSPGQTLIFLGDHTSPDHPGYVALLEEVLSRFRPDLRLRLISAGSAGQSAAGLRSPELLQMLSSARPDWLVVGIGLADALREPAARLLMQQYQSDHGGVETSSLDATFGPELQPRKPQLPADFKFEYSLTFATNLHEAVGALQSAGVRVCLLTTILLGNNSEHPVNRVLAEYNHVLREEASRTGALLVDVAAAFRDVFDRAANYKQAVALVGPDGHLNAQGQALVARTVLSTFRVLPSKRDQAP